MGREYTGYQAAERPDRLFHGRSALGHETHAVHGLGDTAGKNGENEKKTENTAHGIFLLSHALTRVRVWARQTVPAGCMSSWKNF